METQTQTLLAPVLESNKDLSTTDSNTTEILTSLDFCCKNWKSYSLKVYDSRTKQIHCTIDSRLRKPQLIFKDGDENGSGFGTAVYHTFSANIDLVVQGIPIQMKPTKMLSASYTYPSSAFGGQTMTWQSKSHWKTFDYVLLDENSMAVAKCSAPYWSGDFRGKIEILEGRVVDEHGQREVLIGGFALAYLTLITYYAAIM